MTTSGPDETGSFAPALIRWQRQHGRHGLPWQGTKDPYRIWLSEIMLQQTQVSTVLGYYPRFLARFPDVRVLAAAPPEDVMALWAGLGYYSRARNLHRCAQVVTEQWHGVFPDNAIALADLPGIGASTAAAIAAFCFGERVSIADGNVRRLVSRYLAFDGDQSQGASLQALWKLAQGLLPPNPSHDDMVAYTQGLMDLGSGICTARRPSCTRCPMAEACAARRSGLVEQLPFKSKKTKRRHETWWLVILRGWPAGDRTVWLERRSPSGIWAGLHCVPVFTEESLAWDWARSQGEVHPLEPVCHILTHRELRLLPLLVDLPDPAPVPSGDGAWIRVDDLHTVGLPAPLRTMLVRLPVQAARVGVGQLSSSR